MKEQLALLARQCISPSVRFEIRATSARLKDLASRACLWRWERSRFKPDQQSSHEVVYLGRKAHRDLAKLLMGATTPASATSDAVVLASEVPVPGALQVPHFLSAVVPLGRSLDSIVATYNSELRRSLRKHRPRYHMRPAVTDEEIAHADTTMLQPYAKARHGASASQIATAEVFRLAKSAGRLDLILRDDEVVACHLGCVITRAGKRYWSTIRFGYPESVFADAKQLREVNSITTFMALEWALENGFDYYDIGCCLARPDDGLLEWKRRRGGDVDTLGNHAHFFVRLPRTGSEWFLWSTPLFAVEDGRLTLHLGVPEGPSDEEIASRYREMGFGGLSKVYLHCSQVPSPSLIETLRSRYAHLNPMPIIQTRLTR
ncbi:hypothetical protein [Pseudomonas sp. HTZ2]|uniref:hypothetical protein n=1 Tax=Pseudomonas sp. HTZ2 TaxID=3075220 RepID=UPI002958B2B6|nr:hypothetical protein [Pseudomonas sp. HTZ2]